MQSAPHSTQENKATIKDANEKIEVLMKQLSETNAKTVLSALAAILAFPPQYWKQHKDYIYKITKEFIGLGFPEFYLDLISSLPPKYVKKNIDLYLPILKEITTHYEGFRKKLSIAQVLKILKRFSNFNYRNPAIFNLILTDIARFFNNMRNEDLFEVVNAFAMRHIKQVDLFDRILGKVIHYPFGFAPNLKFLILSFFRVGFDSQMAKNNILQIFAKLQPTKVTDILAFICYVPVVNLPREAEAKFLEENIKSIKVQERPFAIKNLLYTYEFLKHCYRDKPELAEKIKGFITDFEAAHSEHLAERNAMKKVKNMVI